MWEKTGRLSRHRQHGMRQREARLEQGSGKEWLRQFYTMIRMEGVSNRGRRTAHNNKRTLVPKLTDINTSFNDVLMNFDFYLNLTFVL